jgi:hypothetical protein
VGCGGVGPCVAERRETGFLAGDRGERVGCIPLKSSQDGRGKTRIRNGRRMRRLRGVRLTHLLAVAASISCLNLPKS